MSEKNKETKKEQEYSPAIIKFGRMIKERFDLGEDNATQFEVITNVTKGVEFKGSNLWVLICATFIASLGLNVNSTAVIIGAMLVSPLMGPIIGIGLSLGVNDFSLLKKSLRNFLWMFVVSAVTSTVFFLLIPSSNAQSELLARTSPTTYDVLIAFFGGLAGMLAQTRRDRTGTVISGVAIATALMPPLCTVGFGIATGEVKFILGALYLFLINTVFIAFASYLMVVFLKYDKKETLDKLASKRIKHYMLAFVIIVMVPSTIMTFNIIGKTQFEANAERYIDKIFKFNKTLLVDHEFKYKDEGGNSIIEVKLVGEPLSQNVIDNASSQMASYSLENTKLVVLQADEKDNFSKIQTSYSEIIDEKNRTISSLEKRLSSLQVADTISVSDISKEVSYITNNIGALSLSKQIVYDTKGTIKDTTIIVVIRPETPAPLNTDKVKDWLHARLKTDNINIYVEKQ